MNPRGQFARILSLASSASRYVVALLLTLVAIHLLPGNDTAVAQGMTDTDGDGMDDAWEVTYFGNLSATTFGTRSQVNKHVLGT